jgi:serine/threonine-protein kinase
VPNVVNIPREQAEQQLKDAGLKVGRVTPEYSDKVPENVVMAQDVSSKKRVFHDTAVSLTVSNGPDPANPATTPDSGAGTPVAGDTTNPDAGPQPGTDPPGSDGADAQDKETHTFSRTISISHDGRGRRQVRVEYKDALGEHPAVIDEGHEEGDKILIKFDYVGKAITLIIQYDGQKVFDKTFDPQTVRKRTIQ